MTRHERKLVTVLFCDLVGFTSLAEELDPEDVAAVLDPYHGRLRVELERYGGTVEKFIGDAVMALFGAPVAHEDDPERAVRAALAIRDVALDEGLELRIGIATGEALVALDARPDAGETMATGDVVNTAARLQAAAPVNGILVSERTFRATRHAVELLEREPVAAKGKSRPVPVWEALSASSEALQERSHLTPLVGRARELDALHGALERACADRQPQLVTLVGVPGIGKSRLVRELRLAAARREEPVTWLQGRCLPYGDGVTFAALTEILEQKLDVTESDSAAAVEEKLRAAVADEWVRGHLRVLVGLASAKSGDGQREEAYAAWRTYVEQVAAEQPLVLVVEDLHWSDEALLDFVDYLVDWASGVALLVLCTTRPELLERRPAWGGGKANASTVSLGALTDDEIARLVGLLLDRSVMAADVQRQLLDRAGGNPLYAEQFSLLLEERGGSLALPESVQGLVAARLDMLASDQKQLLQDAAVVGTTFWLGSLHAISGVDQRSAELALHALERKGFVARERATSILGDVEFVFQHVVVRDVAYGQIPRALRSEKHRSTAEWIETLDRREDADLLAHHYGEALALARAARLETTPLETPARTAFRVAGDRASEVHAYAAAARLYEQALELWPDSDPGRAELLFRRARMVLFGVDERRYDLFEEARDAFLRLGRQEDAAEAETLGALALRRSDRGADAIERARQAVALVELLPASRQKTYVLANCARLLVVAAFRYADAIEMAETALEAARQLSLPELEAHCLNTIGIARSVQGEVDGLDQLEESLQIGLEHCPPFEVARIYNNLGTAYWNAGRLSDAYVALRAGLDFALRFGLPTNDFEIMVAVGDFELGRWDDAAERIEKLRAAGAVFHQTHLHLLADLRLGRGDLVGAASACDESLALTRAEQWSLDAALTLQFALGFRAYVALSAGEVELARGRADELLAIDIETSQVYPGALVLLALVLAELGMADGAPFLRVTAERVWPWHQVVREIVGGRLVAAADRLAEIGAVTAEAQVRLHAAERLLAEGRRREADVQLARALAFYRSVGAAGYVRRGEALLAETA